MIEFKNIDKDDKDLVEKIYASAKGLDAVEMRKIIMEMLNDNKTLVEEQLVLAIPSLVLKEAFKDEEEEEEEDDKDKKKVKEEEGEGDPDNEEDEDLKESEIVKTIREAIEALNEKATSSNDDKPSDDPSKKPKPEGSGDGKGKGTDNPKKEPKNDDKKGNGKTQTKTKTSKDGSSQVPLSQDFKDKVKDEDDHIKKKG